MNQKRSLMVEHSKKEHPGEEIRFDMRVKCFPKTALSPLAFQIDLSVKHDVDMGVGFAPKTSS